MLLQSQNVTLVSSWKGFEKSCVPSSSNIMAPPEFAFGLMGFIQIYVLFCHLSHILWVDNECRWCHGNFCGITVTGGGGDWTYDYIWECLYNLGHEKCLAFGIANEVHFIYGILNLYELFFVLYLISWIGFVLCVLLELPFFFLSLRLIVVSFDMFVM
jgi:hypothetical protein